MFVLLLKNKITFSIEWVHQNQKNFLLKILNNNTENNFFSFFFFSYHHFIYSLFLNYSCFLVFSISQINVLALFKIDAFDDPLSFSRCWESSGDEHIIWTIYVILSFVIPINKTRPIASIQRITSESFLEPSIWIILERISWLTRRGIFSWGEKSITVAKNYSQSFLVSLSVFV